MGQFTFVDSL